MNWINYHHLYYFWLTAKNGSIASASKELKLARPTVSAQIQTLQDTFGQKLFEKSGRNIKMTKFGKDVFYYADEIFSTGQKLKDFVQSMPEQRPQELTIGISDIVPKLISYNLIAPIMMQFPKLKIVCLEGNSSKLVADLAVHNIDAIISDMPVGGDADVRIFHHKLGECAIAFFCRSEVCGKNPVDFPACLNQLPLLLPSRRTSIRRAINLWMENKKVFPRIVGEFDDSALMKVFGENQEGAFVAPTSLKKMLLAKKNMVCLGEIGNVKETFYLASTRKRLQSKYLKTLVESANRSFSSL